MRRNRMLRGTAAASAAMLSLAACTAGSGDASGGGGGGDTSLRYAFFAPIESFPGVQMEEWAKRLNEQTDTEVSVDMFAGGTLLGSGDIFDGVSEGVVDVGMDSPAYDVNRFPLSSVVTLPLGFQCSQSASMTILDLLQEYDPKEFEGYEIVTAFTTEPAYIQSKQPVTSMADLAGLELRTSGALTSAMESLGASPVGMPMPDVAQSLQTGVINGYVSSREVLKDFALANQVGYITDYSFGVSNTFVAAMDQERFDRLPEDVRRAIEDLRPKMTEFASSYHDEENVGGAVEWANSEKGVETVQLADAEKQKWDSRTESVVNDWLKRAAGNGFDPQEVLNRAQELADKYAGLCQQG
jgi:TRAP-type C4-dicarboxylate transport system substrate-binding protein